MITSIVRFLILKSEVEKPNSDGIEPGTFVFVVSKEVKRKTNGDSAILESRGGLSILLS